jgi:ferritin-like metal-binding protein YciE
MPTIETLDALLKHELKDLFSAETQIVDALPQMIEAANNKELKTALNEHLEVTKKQRDRLNEIQELFGDEKVEPEKKGFFANLFTGNEGEEHCKAMEGLIKEGNDLLGEDMSTEVKDAAIIAAAQKIEHYEISSYGTARAYALQLQLNDVARLLETTLKEEYDANDSLTVLALSKVNLEAENSGNKPGEANNKKTDWKTASKKAAKPVKKASKAAPKKTKKAAPQKTKKAAPKKVKKAAPKKTNSANRNSKTKNAKRSSKR